MVAKSRKRAARKAPARTTRASRSEWSREDGLDGATITVDPLDGKAYATPVAVQRLSEEQRGHVAQLMLWKSDLRALEADIESYVHHLRELGISWNVIGYALGTTGQGAAKRYGDHS